MHDKKTPVPGNFITCLVILANAIVLEQGMISHVGFYWLLLVTVPLLLIWLLQRT